MVVRKLFFYVMLCGLLPLFAGDKPAMDDQERELKTWIDRTRKKLIAHNCEPVSEANYSEVYKDICDLAAACSIEKPEIFLVDADSPAGVALNVENIYFFNNAWVFSRRGITTLIIVDKGLFELLTPQELKSIIAHEFSHIVYNKDWLDYEMRIARVAKVVGYIGFGASMTYFLYVFELCAEKSPIQTLRGLGACALGYTSLIASRLFSLWRCRKQEKGADLNAIRLTKSKVLVSALEKMHKRLDELYPVAMRNAAWYEKWMPWLLDHPTLAQRKGYIETHELSA